MYTFLKIVDRRLMIFDAHLFKEHLLIVMSITIRRGKVDVMSITYSHGITNNFPGGQFIHVRILSMIDSMRPFEHESLNGLLAHFH
jgi:hypothetical protein